MRSLTVQRLFASGRPLRRRTQRHACASPGEGEHHPPRSSTGVESPLMRPRSWLGCAVCALGVCACGSGSSGGASPPPASKARAPVSPISVTLSRSEGGKHDRFAAVITPRHATGVKGKGRSNYTLAAKAADPAVGCVNNRDRRFPDGPRGTPVRAALDPGRGEGGLHGWCPGRYKGTVTYFEGFACPSRGKCHIPGGFPTRTQIVARFSFHVN